MKFYVNGVSQTTETKADSLGANSIQSTANFTIGARNADTTWNAGHGDSLAGKRDEVRISSIVRSANWMWATYQTVAANTNFGVYGTAVNTGIVITNLYIQNGGIPTGANLGATQATVTATVVTNGGSDATGYLFYDTVNRGTNLTWAFTNSVVPTVLTSGTPVTNTITGLSPGRTYYFMYYATNSAGQTSWGGSTGVTFTTLVPPGLNNGSGATSIGINYATLNGTLTNGVQAYCAIYWWTNGAPTTNSVNLGLIVQGNSFFTNVTGLTEGTVWYYQCQGSNDTGIGWSTVTNFTTGTSGPIGIWANTNGGNYTIAGNWLNSQIPNVSGTATFLSNATYQVDFPASVTNKAADFEAAGGTVKLNIGAGNLWALTNAFSLGTNAGAIATVAVPSGTLRASAGTMNLGNGVLTNSGSGVIEVGTPGVTSYPLLYVPANMTCTVSQVTIRGANLDNTWSCGGPGTLVLNSAFPRSPDLIGDPTYHSYSTHFTVSNGTIKAGAANVFGLPSAQIGGYLAVTSATLDMNGYDQAMSGQNIATFAATSRLINSGANATWSVGPGSCITHIYGTVEDGTTNDASATGLITLSAPAYQTLNIYRGGQTVKDITGLQGSHVTINSTSSTDHNTVYGSVSCTGIDNNWIKAYLYADTFGHISRTLGGKEADGTTDRFVTIGVPVYLYIQGDGGANLSNGSYTNNNDVAASATIVLDRNDAISKNVTYTMRNLTNGVAANTGTNGFRLKFWGTNTLTASSTHTVTGSLLINQIAESGGPRALTKAGTGTLEIYGSGLFSTNLLTAGTNIVSGSVTNRYLAISSGAALSMAGSGYLKVTNNLMNTNGASTVKFTASPTAVGRIDVTGVWSNSATAKLAVDLTGYTWPSGPRAVLATFQSMPTLFAAGNTTIAGAKAVSVYYTPTTLELRKMVGTAVFFW